MSRNAIIIGVVILALVSCSIVAADDASAEGSYEISFDAMDGTFEDGYGEELVVTQGESVTLPSATRTGYTLSGWTVDGTVVGQPGDSYTPAGDVRIYAKWAGITYKVQFLAGPGSGTMDDQVLTYGAAKTLTANAFTKEDCNFSTWLGSDGRVYGDKAYVLNLASEQDAVVTLTAQWTTDAYTVSFRSSSTGWDGWTDAIAVATDGTAVFPECGFHVSAYAFDGWKIGQTVYQAGADMTGLASAGTTLTAYTVWKAAESTVAFDPNGGTGTMESMKATYGEAFTFPECGFERTGYEFDCWRIGNTAYDAGSTSYELASSDSPTLTAYAVWNPIGYTISFLSNGGTGSMDIVPAVYGDEVVLPECGFSREGYTFKAWTLDGTEYAAGTSVKNLATESGAKVELSAVWTANSYTIVFNANGGTGTMDDLETVYDALTTLTACSFTKEGAAFGGWICDGKTYADGADVKNLTAEKDGKVTMVAQWTTEWILTFVTDTAKDSEGNYAKSFTRNVPVDGSIELPDVDNPGYKLTAWYSIELQKYIGTPGAEYHPNSDLTLVPTWGFIRYGIVFDGNGADSGEMARQYPYYYDSKITLSENTFVRTGYVFGGWSFGDQVFADKAQVKNLASEDDADATLKAIWTPVSYTIVFDANGGTGSMGSIKLSWGEKASLTSCVFSREGYSFDGWLCDGKAYADKAEVSDLASAEGATVKMVAQWKAIAAADDSKDDGKDDTREKIDDAKEKAKEAVDDAKEKSRSIIDEHGWMPIALAVGALASVLAYAFVLRSPYTLIAAVVLAALAAVCWFAGWSL